MMEDGSWVLQRTHRGCPVQRMILQIEQAALTKKKNFGVVKKLKRYRDELFYFFLLIVGFCITIDLLY